VVALLQRPLIALAALMFGVAGTVAQQAVFSSRVEAVRVDVLVTDNGRPVHGLKPEDFEVLDNGVPQKVELGTFEQIPLNVVLVLDMSASLQGVRLGHLQTAGRTLLDGLKSDDAVALVTFSNVVVQGTGLTTDRGRVRAALDQARGSGNTALIDASYAGMLIGESGVGRSLMIVFSDGVDTASWLLRESVMETARRSDVVAYGVEVGQRGASFPKDLSAATGGRLIEIESTQDLTSTFGGILEEFRTRYLVSYSPQGVTTGGWHRLDVRVKNRDAVVKARPGYLSGS
jgi:Ca-activated chloride channel family protein